MFLPSQAEPSSSWCLRPRCWRGAAGVASAGRLWCVGQLSSPEGCCRRFGCLGRPSGAVPGRAGGVPHRSRSPGTRSPRLAREESAARHPCQPHLVENTFPPLQLALWNEPGTAGETSLAGHLRRRPTRVVLLSAAPSQCCSSAPGRLRGAGRGRKAQRSDPSEGRSLPSSRLCPWDVLLRCRTERPASS